MSRLKKLPDFILPARKIIINSSKYGNGEYEVDSIDISGDAIYITLEYDHYQLLPISEYGDTWVAFEVI